MSPSSGSSVHHRPDRASLLNADCVDETHIQVFADALRAEEGSIFHESPDAFSPGHATGSSTPSLGAGRRVRKVSALSDFAPVNVKVTRRKKGTRTPNKGQEWLFILLRWPLLTLIFLFIGVEFGFYILIRQMVNAKEWLSAWRGRKGLLRKRLRNAKTYQEWKDAALVLDEYLGFNEWKLVDEDSFYDWKLVRKVLRSLRSLREKNDARGLMGVLETCVRTNFAGIESSRLYSESFYGTKELIEAYVTEQEKALEFVRRSPDLSNDEKKRFFKSVNTNLGTTALCLSGGAAFGYYHFGVVKAFLDADILPRVISGTSAGGIVAALVCCYTDAELREMLVPELATRLTAFEEPLKVWAKRLWKTGARFDSLHWARKICYYTRGSMTFKEAYMRTGRILNISVIPADRHSPTKLLNYMTAPDTLIWTAVLASAAVPGILNPVVLMQKLKDGSIVPWSWGSKWKDGSLRVDIPVQSLNLYFNVTHPVVSQVNPHVHLFFFAPRGSAGKPVAHRKGKGKGWRGNFVLSAAEQWLKLELTKNFKLIRDLDLLPQVLGQDWSSVFLQRFDGTVTIWPRTRFRDFAKILTDPTPSELAEKMRVGELVTWPKIHIIENRFRLEKQILLGRQSVRKALQPRTNNQKAEVPSPDAIPMPITGTQLPIPSAIITSAPTVQEDSPMPIDSDAEAAYVNAASRPPRHRRNSPTVSRAASTADTSRAQALRRRWANSHLNADDSNEPMAQDYGRATPDPPPLSTEPEQEQPQTAQPPDSPTTAASILRRLRTASQTFTPFASIRRNSTLGRGGSWSQRDHLVEPPWSSDSSSSDDDPSSLESRRPNFRRGSMDVWMPMNRESDDFESDLRKWPAEG
ncbi:patatin-domain-containing protein [Cristinia sonorae]|uniref:Patatin-like phospholipase domain-containing protein n=1 Tax=Cristinia sonorae TaxID=1940300 RepID=A0A8K0UX34_9AGAR|nr:patatin-domain-containing protein [Cristinia sonorae]